MAPPPQIAGFEIKGLLGQGGNGVVYLALQTSLDRRVALKVVPASGNAADDRLAEQEAKLLAQLDHPNIIPVYGSGRTANGDHWFAMKYVEGRTLDGQELTALQVVTVLKTVARALHHAHEKNHIHRDIKPSNIFISVDETVYLGDFGIARRIGDSSPPGSGDYVRGTPGYMSPEQLRSERLDARSDLFSLGIVATELLRAPNPFNHDVVAQFAWMRGTEPLPVPMAMPALRELISQMIDRQRDRRPPSALVVAEQLEAIEEEMLRIGRDRTLPRFGPAPSGERSRKHRWPILVATVVAMLVAGAAIVASRRRPAEGTSVATPPSPSFAQMVAGNSPTTSAASPSGSADSGSGSCVRGMILVSGGDKLPSFCLDRTEVTVSAYNECVAAAAADAKCNAQSSVYWFNIADEEKVKRSSRCNLGKQGWEEHPMNCVNWYDSGRYCSWRGVRLPTPEEWRWAFRNGARNTKHPWGPEEPGPQLCWSGFGSRRSATCRVGSFPSGATEFGIVDLAGNVAEWTKRPSDIAKVQLRGYAGGGFADEWPPALLPEHGQEVEPHVRRDDIGFRCAADVPRAP